MHILTIKRNPYPASLAATTMKAFAAVTIMLSMLMSAQTLRAMPQHGDMADAPGKVGYRTIVRVDSVTVNAPAGTAPRLPYQLMVEYSDGSRELRQIRWRNSSEAAEREQADISINPVGSTYTVKGFILGDNTTPDGYPVYADVTVVDGVYDTPSPEPSAQPLPLNKVKVTGDNRLTSNRELAIDHLLSLDVTQQLYNYRDTYGLPTDGYTVSDGWDSPTTKLKGHGSGHYMSAMAFAYACCEDRDKREALRRNIARMVDELRECQERTFVWCDSLGRYWEARDFASEEELRHMQGTWEDFDRYKTQYSKYGYGYLNAIPAQHAALIEMYRAYNNNSWVWAPYYSIHKQLAGLIDIATYVDDDRIADKALLIAKDMGLWVWNRMHYRTYVETGGTQEQRRARPGNRYEMWNMYIAGEVGGMSESLARLAEMVDDEEDKARLIEAANCFDSPAFYDPLAVNVDAIRTRHANQHIPMIVGALRTYRTNADPYYYNLSENFWNMIQGRYRYAMGGVGNGEMFRQPYSQILSMATNVTSDSEGNLYPSPTLNETCCAYNLAKLTKDLNCYAPDDARYMDYYERVLYNQIVGSLHPTHYMTTYQYAVGLNASKPWGNETPQSTCCGGTGSENHVKYQEATYFVSDSTLWIALYMPTEARWDQKHVTISQECQWPAEHSTIRITRGSARFAMKLRVPYWATEGFDIKLNCVSVADDYRPSSYVTIPARKWKKSDVVEVTMPFTPHIDFGPDKMETAATAKNETKTPFTPMWVGALMYGPLVMTATDMESWDDASVSMASDLSDIEPLGAREGKGYEANVYALRFHGKEFLPDYYTDHNTTHYLRLDIQGDPSAEHKQTIQAAIQAAEAYPSEHYTEASYAALAGLIGQSRNLLTQQVITKEQADNCVKAIEAAIGALEATVTDATPLAEALAEAEAISPDIYTDESLQRMRQTITEAERVAAVPQSQVEIDRQAYLVRQAAAALDAASQVDKSTLKELMQIAAARIKAEQTWQALEVKVPEFAPWAPHGYSRLAEQYARAEAAYGNHGRRYSQTEVDKVAADLNAAINTMRPGNLAELEDLGTLLRTVEQAEAMPDTPQRHEAIEYARMVIKYVSDGSGTLDMIRDAETKIAAVLK